MSTAANNPSQSQERAQTFIAALAELDAGGRARLKRNAGRTLAEARDIQRIFFQTLPPAVQRFHYEDYFLIATLFPLVVHRADTGNLGETLRRVRSMRGGTSGQLNSLDRRVQTLLDSDREQLPFRLRQAVRLIAAHRESVSINWVQLLRDVLIWERRSAQLRWAESYYVGTGSISHKDAG